MQIFSSFENSCLIILLQYVFLHSNENATFFLWTGFIALLDLFFHWHYYRILNVWIFYRFCYLFQSLRRQTILLRPSSFFEFIIELFKYFPTEFEANFSTFYFPLLFICTYSPFSSSRKYSNPMKDLWLENMVRINIILERIREVRFFVSFGRILLWFCSFRGNDSLIENKHKYT